MRLMWLRLRGRHYEPSTYLDFRLIVSNQGAFAITTAHLLYTVFLLAFKRKDSM